jgi:hypothetical protein
VVRLGGGAGGLMAWGRGMLGTFGACAAGGLEGYFLELPTRKNIQIHTRTNGETLKTLTDHHLNTSPLFISKIKA